MVTLSSLEKLKRVVESHLKRELDIFEEILMLNEDDLKAFLKWYNNHLLVKGIEEVIDVVRKGDIRY